MIRLKMQKMLSRMGRNPNISSCGIKKAASQKDIAKLFFYSETILILYEISIVK